MAGCKGGGPGASMSLVGNLEDLGLGDILQIVSLSRKSGVLRLTREGQQGAVLFRNGLVVSALTDTAHPRLADALVQQGALTDEQREEALQVWNDTGRNDSLQEILHGQLSVSREKIQQAVRGVVEQTVFGFFNWSEGSFSFELFERGDELAGLDPEQRQFLLEPGLNAQFLAMEGTRLFDESKALGESTARAEPAAFIPPPPPPEPEPPKAAPLAPEKPKAPSRKEKAAPAPAEKKSAAAALSSGKGVVLVVDDDSLTLGVLEAKLAEKGFSIAVAQGTRQGLAKIAELREQGAPFFLLADLLMPRSDEGGILGGIELLDHVKKNGGPLRTALMTDYDNEEAKKKAEAMGVDAFLKKPRKSQLSSEQETSDQAAFLNEVGPLLATWQAKDIPPAEAPAEVPAPGPPLVAQVSEKESAEEKPSSPAVEAPPPEPAPPPAPKAPPPPVLADADDFSALPMSEGPPPPPSPKATSRAPLNGGRASPLVDFRGELAREFEEGFFSDRREAQAVPPSPGLSILKTMTNELNNPNSNVEITLLILRFAAELMNRAVVFVIAPDGIRGLGEFGVELAEGNALKRVRRMRIPLDEPSLLRETYERQAILKGALPAGKWNDYLVEQLGGVRPHEVFLAPIVSSGKVVALLYGDNVPEQREIGDTESLEIFLVQAGIAMDRAYLTRQLRNLPRGAE
ncbi:MAG: response regulator [Bdellovibrionota bacterium]